MEVGPLCLRGAARAGRRVISSSHQRRFREYLPGSLSLLAFSAMDLLEVDVDHRGMMRW